MGRLSVTVLSFDDCGVGVRMVLSGGLGGLGRVHLRLWKGEGGRVGWDEDVDRGGMVGHRMSVGEGYDCRCLVYSEDTALEVHDEKGDCEGWQVG